MRRVLYTLVASVLLAAVVPATALGRSHHRRHHARSHHKIRHRQFGHPSAPVTSPTTGNAGTVASFDGTKLTITLADGSTVSGTVNSDTEIECEAADMSGTSGMSGTSFHRDHEFGDRGDQGDRGDDNDNDDNAPQTCDTSSLTPGTVVHAAVLSLSGAGAVWDKVELVTSSTSSSSSSSTSSSGD